MCLVLPIFIIKKLDVNPCVRALGFVLRLKLNDLIRERLADTLTGNQSYFPEGTKKDSRTLSSDLQDLIAVWHADADE